MLKDMSQKTCAKPSCYAPFALTLRYPQKVSHT
jgi:hypothetical protein